MHKGSNLVKIIIVTPAGHILKFFSPFLVNGSNYDASIISVFFYTKKISVTN